MQKRFKQWGALALVAAMALGLAGCGGTDAKSLMEQAKKNMQDLKSMEANMIMTMDMSFMGQSMQMSVDADMATVQSPMQLKMDMKASSMGENMQMQVYAKETDGKLTMYMNEGSGWQAGEATKNELEEQLQQGNAQNYMNTFIEAATSYKSLGSETVNGKKTEKIECTIKSDAIGTALMASGMEEQMNLEGADAETVAKMFEGVDDLVFTVWVDADAVQVVKMDMDMTQMMKQLMDNSLKQMGGEQAESLAGLITVNEMKFTITMDNINGLSEIEIPQEALDAA